MRRVLVLRPEPAASATAERARAIGLDAVTVPLFEVSPIPWETPDPARFDALLLTSANAVRHGGDELERFRGLQVYAVGDATAKAARDAGFDIAAAGDAGVDRLLGSIEADLKLLHLCGADRREPADARQQITPLAVYKARAIRAPELGEIGQAVALIHSPRAGTRFAELVSDRASVAIAAISEAATAAVGAGWASVDRASESNDEALLALACRLCNNPQPK